MYSDPVQWKNIGDKIAYYTSMLHGMTNIAEITKIQKIIDEAIKYKTMYHIYIELMTKKIVVINHQHHLLQQYLEVICALNSRHQLGLSEHRISCEKDDINYTFKYL